MAPSDVVCWNALNDVAWSYILKQLSWRDIGNARATCRCWRRDVDRCLHRLHLRDPTPHCLTRLGSTFTRLTAVKVTAVHPGDDVRLGDELSELPGALGRPGALRLRSKRPGGGMLRVGQLQLLRSAGPVLTVLCLRSCEVASWAGLEACPHLAQLHLIHCRFSEAAAMGLTRALAELPRLVSLELRCCGRGGTTATAAAAPAARQPAEPHPYVYHNHNHNHNHQDHHHDHHHHHHQQQQQQQQQQQEQQQREQHQLQQGRVHPHHIHPNQHHHHHHRLPQLAGLGSSAPGLTVLRLAAPLPEWVLLDLLRLELPSIRALRELDLELHPAPSRHTVSPLELAAQHAAQHGAAVADGSAASSAPVSYRELATLIPAISVAAPHLTWLRIKSHSRLQDRDLHLLQPLRHLRHLDLTPSPEPTTPPAAPPPHPHPLPGVEPGAGGGAAGAAGADAGGPHDLHPTPLSGSGLMVLLRAAPGLQSLSLGRSMWSAEGLRALGGATTSLTQLRLAGVELPKGFTLCNFLYGFRGLRNLVELDLSGCSGLTDWGLALLGRCCSGGGNGGYGGGGRLRRLYVGGCGELTGDLGVTALAPLMSQLQLLDLSFMEKLTDQGLSGLLRNGALALQSLSLDHCPQLRDAGVQYVAAGCPGLQRLGLDHCGRLSAAGVVALRNLRELRRLSVEGCRADVQAAVAGWPAARPRRSHAAARWWLASGGLSGDGGP